MILPTIISTTNNNKNHHTTIMKSIGSTNNSETKKNLPGLWLGIDLGTTNTTAAFYSPNNHVAKLIRFTPNYSSVQKKNDKYGKILPSAVYYKNGAVDCIGKSALLKKQNMKNTGSNGNDNDNGRINTSQDELCENKRTTNINIEREEIKTVLPSSSSKHDDGVLLTSVKRIWGMDAAQMKDEIYNDETFLESCPFQTIWVDDEVRIVITKQLSQDENNATHKENTIAPIDIAEILLRTIREEASKYFVREKRKKKHIPLGYDSSNNDADLQHKIRHCVITIPAHFSRNQKEKVVQAARKAGFDGYVNTLVESTAAAMAYGLFVSPTKIVKKITTSGRSNDGDTFEEVKGRKILVCDIGGGTTDITIAEMAPTGSNDEDGSKAKSCDPSFHVLATAGERRLGGDDMDEALAQFVFKEKVRDHEGQHEFKVNKDKWNKLLLTCRNVKEEICGDGKDIMPATQSTLSIDFGEDQNFDAVVNQDEFETVIKPLVDKVSQLIHKTLKKCQMTSQSIDEVILVGGATRTPAIRRMLQNTFQKNELCYSIDADAAVAQGAAIQCALKSGLVPKHELRSAMMLDALPHTIGVLVSTGGDDETYVPILKSGMALPAMNCATFQLSDVRQKGVTIVAVEDVGEDYPLQKVGDFNFLLRRLTDKEINTLDDGKRRIDVGMTVDTDAKFIVSVFDSNDPDDLAKKYRYQQWKRKQNDKADHNDDKIHMLGKEMEDGGSKHEGLSKITTEEVVLFISCLSLLGFYLLVRLLFHEPGKDGPKII